MDELQDKKFFSVSTLIIRVYSNYYPKSDKRLILIGFTFIVNSRLPKYFITSLKLLRDLQQIFGVVNLQIDIDYYPSEVRHFSQPQFLIWSSYTYRSLERIDS